MSKVASKIAKNTLYLYIRMAISILISIWSTRLVLNALGASDYGIFSLVGGTIGMLGFLNASMARATQRFMSFYQGKGDWTKLSEVFNVSLVLHFLIALFFIFVLFIAGFVFFNGFLNIPDGRNTAALIIYGSLIVSSAFTIMTVPYDAVLNAHENMGYYALVGIIESCLKLGVAFACVYTFRDKLIVYGVLMACIPLLSLMFMRFYCCHNYTECRISLKVCKNREIIKELFCFAGWNFLGTTATTISNYGLWVVVNIFHGVLVNTALSIAQQIDTHLKVFSSNMLKAFNPVITKCAGRGDEKLMMKYTFFSSKLSFYMFSFLVVPFFIEAPYILKLWLKNIPEWTILFCRLQLIVSLLGQQGQTLITAINADGHIKNSSIGVSFIYFSSILLTIVLFKIGMPAWSLYISTILLNALAFSILHIMILRRKGLLNLLDYIVKMAIPCLLTILLTGLIASIPLLFLGESFLRLLLVFFVSILIFIFCFVIFGFDIHERIILIRFLYYNVFFSKIRGFVRRIYMYLLVNCPLKAIVPSEEEIDVVIPVTKKDLKTLPLCLEGVRNNITNYIREIYIVAAKSEEIKDFCEIHHCVFVDEECVFGFKPSKLNLIVQGYNDRSGWLFQQLVKLSGKVGSCDNYLCVDADHILIRNHTFLSVSGKPVFYMSLDNHQPYFEIITKLSSISNRSLLSYISHKMLFNKEQVDLLQKDIENKTGEVWYEAILHNYDRNENSGFSEFELYGNFVREKIRRPWKQLTLPQGSNMEFKELCNYYGDKYLSLTIPVYAKNYI